LAGDSFWKKHTSFNFPGTFERHSRYPIVFRDLLRSYQKGQENPATQPFAVTVGHLIQKALEIARKFGLNIVPGPKNDMAWIWGEFPLWLVSERKPLNENEPNINNDVLVG
jgi:hypothetical protein